MANNPFSTLDGQQTLRKAFDDATGGYREEVISTPLPPNAAQEAGGQLQSHGELLFRILMEMKAMRMALVAIATDGGRNSPEDFNPQTNDFDEKL